MRFVEWIKSSVRAIGFAAILIALIPEALAQQPSVAAMTTAREIIKTTGATALFNPLIPGVIEQAKNLFLQQNPGLIKDLNDIAAQLRADFAPRFDELTNEVAQLYATHFTEQELRDLLAFYKTPVGMKLITEQPKIGEEGIKFAQGWANNLTDEAIAKMRDELKKRGHAL
ncbi:MAG TPA: DUF2059 domain-containing protein [Pseudolabrys sp.]|jgi:hypothetical protein|nr:DUF2059 domain-containing protein [Pseudolabrys sp.]